MEDRRIKMYKLLLSAMAAPALVTAALAGAGSAAAGSAGASCDTSQGNWIFYDCVRDFLDSACAPHPGYEVKFDREEGTVECAWHDATSAPAVFDETPGSGSAQDSDQPSADDTPYDPQRSGEVADDSARGGDRPAE